ncbi:DUF5050 domain-containing protein [Alkalihalobacillus deserti]|uniref:DUF5050 domain-containing protein n=1 Tax=Alkalihalobacillus deserti TaxID=2879466 RepID=UPI001D13AF61|nr:DUF5050 domain-containing protein [Alkalihalobacillus deserti]
MYYNPLFRNNPTPFYRQQYGPVTAQLADRPILVNGVDINTGLYPVLNYQPPNAQYPYIYVPIAEFRRVGARVVWDPNEMVIKVTSDYDQLKAENEQLKQRIAELEAQIPNQNIRGNDLWVLMNGGAVAKQGDWIYYNNPLDNGSLYKIKTDGTGKQKLNADNSIYINVIGEWIYYVNNTRGAGRLIYKIKIDGSNQTRLTDVGAQYVNVYGDWIYYLLSSSDGISAIYKIKTDGTNQTQLTSGLDMSLAIYNDWIYFSEGFTPARIKFDGSNKQTVANVAGPIFSISGEWLYYPNHRDNYKIYRVNLDGTNNTKLTDDDTYSLTATSDWLYYTHYSDNFKIYRMRSDGSEKVLLFDQRASYLHVLDDWIYFQSGRVLYRMQPDGTQLQPFG